MHSLIEPLEARIAPAVLVGNAGAERTLIYDDLDGDVVTLTITRGVLLTTDFTFDSQFETEAPQQLRRINFADPDDVALDGTNLTIAVKRGPAGDGLVAIGHLNAAAITLGDVKIAGDLGKITTAFSTVPSGLSIKSLKVASIGQAGLDSQGGTGDLASEFNGRVGTIDVRGDVVKASIGALNIKKLIIGGSLIGGSADGSGSLVTQSELFDVLIKGDIRGGGGHGSGQLASGGAMGKVVLGGSLLGGSGEDTLAAASGAIRSGTRVGGNIGSLTIGGSVVGAEGLGSGSIDFGPTPGRASTIAIKGSLTGGQGDLTGSIFGGGDLKSLTLGGSVVGSASYFLGADFRGQIFAGGKIATLTMKGDLTNNGGTGGTVKAIGALGNVTIGGSAINTAGTFAFGLMGAEIGLVKIAGDFHGGDRATLGGAPGILSGGNIAGVSIGGSVTNLKIAAGDQVGAVSVKRGAADLTILGRGQKVQSATVDLAIRSVMIGGTAERVLIQGGVTGIGAVNPDAQIGAVTVGGDWIAGSIVTGMALNAGHYGDGNDVLIGPDPNAAIASRISSITIKGLIVGTPTAINNTDHFGFVAEQIGAFKLGGFALKLKPTQTDTPFVFSYPTATDAALVEV